MPGSSSIEFRYASPPPRPRLLLGCMALNGWVLLAITCTVDVIRLQHLFPVSFPRTTSAFIGYLFGVNIWALMALSIGVVLVMNGYRLHGLPLLVAAVSVVVFTVAAFFLQ